MAFGRSYDVPTMVRHMRYLVSRYARMLRTIGLLFILGARNGSLSTHAQRR